MVGGGSVTDAGAPGRAGNGVGRWVFTCGSWGVRKHVPADTRVPGRGDEVVCPLCVQLGSEGTRLRPGVF